MQPIDSKPRCPCGYRATSRSDLTQHMYDELAANYEHAASAYDRLTSEHVAANEHRLGALGAQDLSAARRNLVRCLPPVADER